MRLCQVPEIKNDKVHLNVNLPLKSKSSLVEVYLAIICSSFCSTAWGKARIPTQPNAESTAGFEVDKERRSQGWGTRHLEEPFTTLIMAQFGP